MQVLCRYPTQCERYAGALQVSYPVSGVCRYSAGILPSVSIIVYLTPAASPKVRRLSACTCAPTEKVTLCSDSDMSLPYGWGVLCLASESETDEAVL